ncbi:MAG: DNA phosphorothioation-associated putative methyltransferase [Cyanobacteria bacterium P01_A01_bin.45]
MVEATAIERHKAAIHRTDLSRPVKLAMELKVITKKTSFFDYGCGHGDDMKRLKHLGYKSRGWDPYYASRRKRVDADIVNLGYVLNVIENSEERRECLWQAWELSKQVLIVAAQVLVDAPNSKHQIPYGDGIVTSWNTFQKYYDQEELKTYIDNVLQVDAIPVALGIYFVFRDDTHKESFRAAWFRSGAIAPRIRIASKKFANCKQQLEPLMEFYTQRGRIPVKGELEPEIEEKLFLEFGSYNKAFKIILQATDEAEWDAIAYRRSLDIQVYLALTQFDKRPQLSKLPEDIRYDIKAFFGTYQDACQVADQKLFSVGQTSFIKTACDKSTIGKRTRGALYIHISALNELDPLLRIYEGCASRVFGRAEDTTLIKLYIGEPRISYLSYPEFDTDPHPALKASISIHLQTFKVTSNDYSTRSNPPILHRKEAFVSPKYPLYEQFAQLTQQEVELGLLSQTSNIGTRKGWEDILAQHNVEIKGHEVHTQQ